MAKKTHKIFSYGSMSLSIFRRSLLTIIVSISCLFVSLKVLSIYAQEATESPPATPEVTVEQPAEIPTETDNPPGVADTPEVPSETPSSPSSDTPNVSEDTEVKPDSEETVPLSETPEVPLENPSEGLSPIPPEDSSPDNPSLGEDSHIDIDPEDSMTELLDIILREAEKEAEENPEKDPEDTTDEDPDVDLQDLSLESEAPAPELEPVVFVVQIEEEELSESTDSSASLISLLDPEADIIPLLTRTVSDEIQTDIAAKHSCRLEKFRADVSESSALKMRVKFLAGSRGDYEAEIGSLPTGIDVVFAQNREYIYPLVSRDTVLDLEIINQVGSFDGNFSIPIIYRKKGEQDSSVICQMNLRNESDTSGE